jgi:hypothetical protein
VRLTISRLAEGLSAQVGQPAAVAGAVRNHVGDGVGVRVVRAWRAATVRRRLQVESARTWNWKQRASPSAGGRRNAGGQLRELAVAGERRAGVQFCGRRRMYVADPIES